MGCQSNKLKFGKTMMSHLYRFWNVLELLGFEPHSCNISVGVRTRPFDMVENGVSAER